MLNKSTHVKVGDTIYNSNGDVFKVLDVKRNHYGSQDLLLENKNRKSPNKCVIGLSWDGDISNHGSWGNGKYFKGCYFEQLRDSVKEFKNLHR